MATRSGYATEALVLRTIPFGDTSQVVHLATPEHGLVAALAHIVRGLDGFKIAEGETALRKGVRIGTDSITASAFDRRSPMQRSGQMSELGASAPDFWSDQEKAQVVMRKRAAAVEKLEGVEKLSRDLADAGEYLELLEGVAR